MAKAKMGDKVKVHYNGLLEDGTEFDTSREKDPLEFTLGEQTVIAGFEDSVIGMEVGEKKSISIPPEQAYGEMRENLIVEVARTQLPQDVEPKVGMMLQASSPDGDSTQVTIVAVKDDTITIDGNHPLAGQQLKFDLELVEIN